jgi:hypothetical protein
MTMKKQFVVMFALFLVLMSSAACEKKSTDVKPDEGTTTEENAGGTEASKDTADAGAAKADAGSVKPEAPAKPAEAPPAAPEAPAPTAAD